MKQLLILILIISAGCSSTSNRNDALIKFTIEQKNLGELKYKEPKTVSFEVQNEGQTPLIILDVKTSCGCTVPAWNKKPIRPGKKGSIEVTYDSDFPGRFKKTITVFYNGANSPDTLLISGEVEYTEELTRN
ncbi:MAG: DUF1573 domain-containing protein [Salinivirgaceae bacterium]|nr:DUF1573 domain-containing protein [Salinivirgaceae bacterium]